MAFVYRASKKVEEVWANTADTVGPGAYIGIDTYHKKSK